MKTRARALFLFSSVGCLLFACASGREDEERIGDSDSALSFSEGDNDGYCASNPSGECGSGTPLGNKVLALTCDDGPGSRTLELSGWLRDHGIQATFFVNGMHYGSDAASLIQQVIADGHLVGNHTQDHLDLTSLSNSDIISEVEETDNIIAPYIPNNRFLFRAPYGAWDSNDYSVLQATPMKKYVGPVKWDIGGAMTSTYAADWDCWQNQDGYGVMTTKQCGDRYLAEIHDVGRGIILTHDQDYGDSTNHSLTSGEGNSIDMIEYIVPILQSEGYTFVRVDSIPDIAKVFGGTGGTKDAGSGGTTDAGKDAGGTKDAGGSTDAGSGGSGGTCSFNPTWEQTSYANDWWIEYTISGSITAASFEVVGGATTTLSSSYGKWVGSPPDEVPSGTPVRVHATNSAGQTAVTQTFAYMQQTTPTTDCGSSSGTPDAGAKDAGSGSQDAGTKDAGSGTKDAGTGTTDAGTKDAGTTDAGTKDAGAACFAPTWSEGDGANTWWVEYYISGTIASAYLEVPNEGTVTLTLDEYGKWTGGSDFEIPAGTSVIVHATNTAGATAETTPFAYLNVADPTSAACK